MKLKLYVHTGGNVEWLSQYDDMSHYEKARNEIRPAKESDLTTGMVAEYLDRRAEGENAHDFVGVHANLAKIMEDVGGEEFARKVMRKLLAKGGLQGLKG